MTATTDLDTADGATVDVAFGEAINMALAEALAEDDKVFLLGEDIPDPAGGPMMLTKGLSTKYGLERVRETPISEAAIAGVAVGAALAGYRPVAEIMMMDFLPIAMDQLVNHAAKVRFMTAGKMAAPLTIRAMIAARLQAGATHGQSLEAWFMHVPGLKVAIPSNPYDAKGLLSTCIFDDDPCLFLETVPLLPVRGSVPVGPYRIPLGSAAVRREGSDATIVTYGWTVHEAMAAAEQLAGDDISVEVIDLRSLVPLDYDTVLASVTKTRRAVVLHGAVEVCGPGAEIATVIGKELFGSLAAPIERVAASNSPIPSAAHLEAAYYPTVPAIAAAVRRTLEA